MLADRMKTEDDGRQRKAVHLCSEDGRRLAGGTPSSVFERLGGRVGLRFGEGAW